MARRDEDDQRSGEGAAAAAGGRNGPAPWLIALVVFAALVTVFFVQNSDSVGVTFWGFDVEWTLRWTILVSVLFGAVLDRLVAFWWRRRRQRRD